MPRTSQTFAAAALVAGLAPALAIAAEAPKAALKPTVSAALSGDATSPLGITKEPGRYVDPTRGYFLPVPPLARVTDLKGQPGIAIQSRRGYAINVQTGDVSPGTDLAQMIARLDARYVGRGKPWRAKLQESDVVVGGMAARQALYESASMSIRVVIVRARKTDFVFMFFAPQPSFERLSPEFEWVLGHFQPAPDDRPARIAETPAEAAGGCTFWTLTMAS